MPERIGWTRDQQLIALRLYVGTAFVRLDGRNPEIVALAGRIGRSPNALLLDRAFDRGLFTLTTGCVSSSPRAGRASTTGVTPSHNV